MPGFPNDNEDVHGMLRRSSGSIDGSHLPYNGNQQCHHRSHWLKCVFLSESALASCRSWHAPRCSTILGTTTTGPATTSAPGHTRNNKGVSKVSVGGAIPRLMSYCSPFTASLPTLSTAAKTKRARTSESQNNGQKRWT